MKRTIWLIVILVIFLLTLGVLVYYIRYRTAITPRASGGTSVSTVSTANSYIFSSPIRAKSGGDFIRVTIFLLDETGKGMYDQKVVLKANNNNLEVKEIQNLTDETGRAIFDVGTTYSGVYILEAMTSNVSLPQKIKVIFD